MVRGSSCSIRRSWLGSSVLVRYGCAELSWSGERLYISIITNRRFLKAYSNAECFVGDAAGPAGAGGGLEGELVGFG